MHLPSGTGQETSTAHRWIGGSTAVVLVGLGLAANLAAATPWLPLALAAGSAVWLLGTGVTPGALARRLAIPWYLALVAALTQMLLVGTTPMATLGPVVIYAEGSVRGVLLASKMLGGAGLALALGYAVSPTELLAIASALRLPQIVVEIAILTYRYLFLLAEEAGRIREAQAVRLGWANWRYAVGCAGSLAGMVVINAYDRSERVYQAMLVRGYTGAPIAAGTARAPQWPLVLAGAAALGTLLWLGGIR